MTGVVLGACVLLGLMSLAGCSREWYRQQADDEAACLIDEKSYARWDVPYDGIDMDTRSRFHDPFNPVAPPMPEDDTESHRLMHHVNGKRGWDKWHDNGDIIDLENPDWRTQLSSYADVDDNGTVQLALRDAVQMSRINAPNYQRQVETLYLSALDVSTERFRLQTQFFGGAGAGSGGRSFFNNTTVGVTGSETSGRSSFDVGTNTDIELRRQFATAGELVVGFANSLVWQFSGGDTNFASSAISFAFMQPLLRAGGRQIALETLTIAERTLLANLRAFEHFRQGFYTQIAIGENGTTSPNRRGGFAGSSGLSGFTGQGSGGFGGVGDATGFGGGGGNGGNGNGGGGVTGSGFAGGGAGTVGGFIGLLQQYQQIRNTENSLRAQQQTLQLLEAHLDAGLIDIAQVDQFRQSIETERANLLQARNGYVNTLEGFKTFTLGLPPDLPLDLKDDLIQQFRFVDADIEALQTSLQTVVEDFGLVADQDDVSAEALRGILLRQAELLRQCNQRRERIAAEVADLPRIRELRFGAMDAGRERELAEHEFDRDRERLEAALTTITKRIETSQADADALLQSLGDDTRDATMQGIVGMNVELNQLATELVLIQTRARLEAITLERISIDSNDALEIARANRFDWMNNRAALVDTWRLIEFNGNRLESNVDIFINGEMGTIGDNGVRFRPENSTVRAGLRFDAPFNRLVERNNFRAQLIFYQQSRRQLIQYEDGIHRGLRALLRELEQLELNMEIQRRAVAIAIRRVDQTRETLNRPTPPPEPGAPVQQFGPTAALNLLTALSDLRSSQNNFMSVWLNYYAGRMRLMRELGILRLDEDGVWIDEPIESALRASDAEMPLPPSVPEAWFHELDRVAAPGADEHGSTAAGSGGPDRLVAPGTLALPGSETAPDTPEFPAPAKPVSPSQPLLPVVPGNEPRALPAPEEPGLPVLELPPTNPAAPKPPVDDPAANPEAAATRQPVRSNSPSAQPAGHWTPTTAAPRPGSKFASLPLTGHAQRRTAAGAIGEVSTADSRPVKLPAPQDTATKSLVEPSGQWRATGKPGSAK